MKKLLCVLIVAILIVSCKKEIHIIQPTIIIRTEILSPFNPLTIEVIQKAEIEGEIISPDYYKWTITDLKNNIVYKLDSMSSIINWTPLLSGDYIISVKIGYDGNKSVTALKQIKIIDSEESLQKRIIGEWIGSARAMFGFTWDFSISIDSSGHYFGHAYNLSDTTYYPGKIFYLGDYNVNGFASDKIIISSFNGTTIEGHVIVTYNNLVTNILRIIKFELKNNDTEMTIWLTNFDGETYGAEYYMEHKFKRR